MSRGSPETEGAKGPAQAVVGSPPAEPDLPRLIANLTHELKTPLHAILAVAEVLDSEVDGPLSAEQRRQVEMIRRNGETLLDLIVDLLDYSSTPGDKYKLRLRRFDVSGLLAEITGSMAHLAAKNGVKLEWEFEDLPQAFVSDTALVRRVLANLISNAIKFSPDGGAVSVFARGVQDGALELQVADSGIGMSPHVQRSIFQEFYQAETGDTRRFGGVGLGLALVKSSLDILGGTIEVKSESERGSLFCVLIPPAEGALPAVRILVVEEDEDLISTLEECLRGEHYETSVLGDVEKMVQEIAERKPDLVMLSLARQEEQGLEAIRRIRRSQWGKELPIIVMSAFDDSGRRARAFQSGASDFIVKPFDAAELICRVRNQVERSW